MRADVHRCYGCAPGPGLLLWLIAGAAGASGAAAPPTPVELYPGLFERVQSSASTRTARPSSTRCRASRRRHPARNTRRRAPTPGFDLAAFVARALRPRPLPRGADFRTKPGTDVEDHIDALWPVLTRSADEPRPRSSLLPLPHRYVVPGRPLPRGLLLGLVLHDARARGERAPRLVADMVEELRLADRPVRPHPQRQPQLLPQPLAAAVLRLMVRAARGARGRRDAAASSCRAAPRVRVLDGRRATRSPRARRTGASCACADGTLLNRYWDDRDTPREESYREDVETARASGRPAARGLSQPARGGRERLGLQLALARRRRSSRRPSARSRSCRSTSTASCTRSSRRSRARTRPIGDSLRSRRSSPTRARSGAARSTRFCGTRARGTFEDYALAGAARARAILTAATLLPAVRRRRDRGAGQGASLRRSSSASCWRPTGSRPRRCARGQQWDAPNGWAPLQWIAVEGLDRYGHRPLARRDRAPLDPRERATYYERDRQAGREVRRQRRRRPQRGGEYPLQDGFGWTNGVLRRLMALYPEAPVRDAAPAEREAVQ